MFERLRLVWARFCRHGVGFFLLVLSPTMAAALSVQGHRGARAFFPENTLEGFSYALAVGVDMIELDIQFTKDDVPVVFHDSYMTARVCRWKDGQEIRGKLPIRQMTYAQTQQFDCGAVQNKGIPLHPVPGATVPTFEEVIELVLATPGAENVGFKVDIKCESDLRLFPKRSDIARGILLRTHAYGIQERSIFSSFDTDLLAELRLQDSTSQLSLLVAGPIGKNTVKMATALKVHTVSPMNFFLNLQGTTGWIKTLQRQGFQVVPWTVNNPKHWAKLISAGVDGIITDDPEGLRALLDSSAQNRPAQESYESLLAQTLTL